MIWALGLAFLFLPQDQAPKTCAVYGSVINSITAEPLNHVEIFAEPVGGGASLITTTDSKGAFSLIDLPPGEYKLKGRRNGYLDTHYGARRVQGAGTTITLEPGAEMKDIQIKLVPFAVLAGTVRETDGEPLAGATVLVFSLTYSADGRHVNAVGNTRTDDLGQYRIANLPPGKYYLRAEPHRDDEDNPNNHVAEDHSPKTAAREVLLPALYPGVVDPAAARAVEAAARITGLDIALPRSRVFCVTGHVTAPAGSVGTVALEPPQEFDGLGSRYPGVEKPNGDFEIPYVPAGSYVLVAGAGARRSSVVFSYLDQWRDFRAWMPLQVGSADLDGVRITVNPGAMVEGRVVVEGDAEANVAGDFVGFEDGTRRNTTAQILEGQVFSTPVSPGTYRVFVTVGKNLVVRSIRSERVDVLRDGLTIAGSGKVSLEIVAAPTAGWWRASRATRTTSRLRARRWY
jgi:hypothetical protein